MCFAMLHPSALMRRKQKDLEFNDSSAFVGAYDETRTHDLILTNARLDVILEDSEVRPSPRILVFQGFRDFPFRALTTPLRYSVAVILARCGICCGTDAARYLT